MDYYPYTKYQGRLILEIVQICLVLKKMTLNIQNHHTYLYPSRQNRSDRYSDFYFYLFLEKWFIIHIDLVCRVNNLEGYNFPDSYLDIMMMLDSNAIYAL